MSTITREFPKELLIKQARRNVEVLRREVEIFPGASDASVMHLRLTEITLASLEAEPVAWLVMSSQGQYVEFDNEHGGVPLYTAPPAPIAINAEPVAKVETVGVCWYADNGVPRKPAVGTELFTAPPAPAVPDGLRLALSHAGIAAPESDEMLYATHEKYVQMLVNWVKDRKPFQPAPETADREMLKRLAVILSGSDAPGEIKALTVTAQSFVDRCKLLSKECDKLRSAAGAS